MKSRRTIIASLSSVILFAMLFCFSATMAADNAVRLTLWWPWGGPSNPQTSFDSAFSDFLAQKIGVRVALNPCQSDATQTINLYRAGKNFPDILFNGVSLSDAIQWEKEGNTIPLNKYFHNPDYPNLAKISDSVLSFFENDNGDIVCIPAGPPVVADLTKPLSQATVDQCQRSYGWFARKDLLEAFGKPLNTMEDIEQFAEFCKKKQALDGTSVEPFGIPRWTTVPSFDQLFLYNFGGRNGFCVDDSGKAVVMEDTQPYYNMMKQLNQWFHQGYISPEVFTDNGDIYAQKIASGKYGMTWTSSWAMVGYNLRMGNAATEYVPIPHWKAPGVTQFMANPDPSANPTQMGWGMMVVSSACKNPDAAMKLIDYLTGDEGYVSGMAGAPGEYWSWTSGKGVFSLTDLGKKIYPGINKDWITEAGNYGNFAIYQYSACDSTPLKLDELVEDPMYALCLNTWKGYAGTLYGHRSATIDMATATEEERTASNEWQPKKAQWVLSLLQAKSADFDSVYKKGLEDNKDVLELMESEHQDAWTQFLAKHPLKDDPGWYGPVQRVVSW